MTKNPLFDQLTALPPSNDCTRTTLVLDHRIEARVVRVHSRSGIIQRTITALLRKLCNELDRINLTDWDPDRYESLIVGASLRLDDAATANQNGERSLSENAPTGPRPNLPTETPQGHDGRGTIAMVSVPQGPASSADVGSASKKRRTGKKAGKGAGTA